MSELIVYGADESYYTGKLEAYLRAKGIAYRAEPFTRKNMRRCAGSTGVVQIPQVECPDGSWLVDTTPTIAYLEETHPTPAITPADPLVRFVSLLLEDYADEWLWRPAMHYRWSYPETARLMSGWLAEHITDDPGPRWMKRLYWRIRQYGVFVRRDGVTGSTRAATEASYLESLAALEAIFEERPFMLGSRPTDADFGFFASMFRHFFCDPTPARIMRARAPAVTEWVARMWNLNPTKLEEMPLPEGLPDGLEPLFDAIAGIYLPYLAANAAAHARGEAHVEYDVQGVHWKEPVKPYRVWCLDQLQRKLAALPLDLRARVRDALGREDAFRVLEQPCPGPVPQGLRALPIPAGTRAKPVDSWWRRR